MKTRFILIIISLYISPIVAQEPYQVILSQIETNSIRLQVLQQQAEVQKVTSRTDIYLSNPEVEFGYLWGNPSVLGNRITLNAKQSFEFPSVYHHKSSLSHLENSNAERQYKVERMNLLLTAKQKCIELLYLNAMTGEYAIHLENATMLVEKYKKKLEKGETNILESNKARLHLNSVQNEVTRMEIEKNAILVELKQLNGGKDIAFENQVFISGNLPTSFEEWVQQAESKSPVLQYIQGEIEIQEKRIKINKSTSLPTFSVGYSGEFLTDERFQGISFGISIPLWENKNQVKLAKIQTRVAQSELEDNKMQFYNQLQNLFYKTLQLQQASLKNRETLNQYGNNTLLKKALDLGEISLMEYFQEIDYYYDAVKDVLEMEKEAELSLSELLAIDL